MRRLVSISGESDRDTLRFAFGRGGTSVSGLHGLTQPYYYSYRDSYTVRMGTYQRGRESE